jgi:hypothetical protein
MRRSVFHAAAVLLTGLALAPAASANAGMLIGAAEDGSKNGNPLVTMAKMNLARMAGFNAVRLTVTWNKGQSEVSISDRIGLENAAAAATLNGIRLFINVYPTGSRMTPLTNTYRKQFADFTASVARAVPSVKDFIIGNEPNLNRFWMPQYNSNGTDSAAPMYAVLLAVAYDSLKAVSPDITVIGGAVSPRGSDNAHARRQTHSPTRFIPHLGLAYRRMHRAKPIMDAFAYHPYNHASKVSPSVRHPEPWSKTITLADYQRLVGALGQAFDGTAQRGSTLPIVYDEYGVQSKIPASKRRLYFNLSAPAGRDAVAEARQAAYYREALKIAYCQPTVTAFLIFHVSDEPDLDRWQSGLFYADDTPKSSFGPVRATVARAHNGLLTRCPHTFHPVAPRAGQLHAVRGSHLRAH